MSSLSTISGLATLLCLTTLASPASAHTYTDPSGYSAWMPSKPKAIRPHLQSYSSPSQAGVEGIDYTIAYFNIPPEAIAKVTMPLIRQVVLKRPMGVLHQPRIVGIRKSGVSGREAHAFLFKAASRKGEQAKVDSKTLLVYTSGRIFTVSATWPQGPVPDSVTRFFSSFALTAAAPKGSLRALVSPTPWGRTTEGLEHGTVEVPAELVELRIQTTKGRESFRAGWRGANKDTYVSQTLTRPGFAKIPKVRDHLRRMLEKDAAKKGATNVKLTNYGKTGVMASGFQREGGTTYYFHKTASIYGASFVTLLAVTSSAKDGQRFVKSWKPAK